jgi:hypothetical protein
MEQMTSLFHALLNLPEYERRDILRRRFYLIERFYLIKKTMVKPVKNSVRNTF